jgi:hypothetical protein
LIPYKNENNDPFFLPTPLARKRTARQANFFPKNGVKRLVLYKSHPEKALTSYPHIHSALRSNYYYSFSFYKEIKKSSSSRDCGYVDNDP